MRYLPLLLCLLAGTILNAQRFEGEEKNIRQGTGWEISASFAPELNKRPFTGVRLETNPDDIPVGLRLGGFDTISIAGQDRIFNKLPSFGFQAEPTSSNLWFGASVTAHRRIGKALDFSAGLFYNQAGYSTSAEDDVVQSGVVNTRATMLYTLEDVSQRSYGISVRGNYHLFPKARLHPYFGTGMNLYSFQRSRTFKGEAYLGDLITVLPTTADPVASSTSSISLDLVVTAGLLLRVNNNWSVGLDLTSTSVAGSGLVGLQVRRRL